MRGHLDKLEKDALRGMGIRRIKRGDKPNTPTRSNTDIKPSKPNTLARSNTSIVPHKPNTDIKPREP